MRKERGITLISLVITIIILVILAAVAINFAIGENGIITKAQEAKRLQAIAAAKEQIGLEILEAQIEAIDNNEELEQSEVQEIVAKYGVLQADGDTIILNDGGYEVSLKDIYNIMANTEIEGDSTTELAQLKALLSQTTVTEDKILKDYKAYKDGRIITGTMENYAGQTVEATTLTESGENAEITIPQAGYYDTTSKISIPASEMNSNLGNLDYGDFKQYTNNSEISVISLDNLEVGKYYVITIHTSKINSEITNYTGVEELEYNALSTSYSGRRLFLANFKATSSNATLTLTGNGLVSYIIRKLT